MSLYRLGKALVRSLGRSAEALKKGQIKASKAPWNLNGGKTVAVQHQQLAQDCITYTSRSSQFWSSFTKPTVPGYANTISKLGLEYGSFLKGHRIFRVLRKGQIQGPLFAFLGFVCTDISAKTSSSAEEEHDFHRLFQWIQKGIQTKEQEMIAKQRGSEDHQSVKLSDYIIGERLGKESSNSAVYEATRNDNQVAIKMMFNYGTKSSSADIQKAFAKEKQVLCKSWTIQEEESCYVNIPPHRNILPVLNWFVDDVPCLPDAVSSYPVALPAKYTQQGLGRNKTMFLVMPRLDITVQEYFEIHQPSRRTSTLLFAQLLDGVSHLVNCKVAHRDLKTDNLLLDTSTSGFPRLVICDFDCCLAERTHGLKLPFVTMETDRGGNAMLMPPEVITAQCGHNAVIDYSKADAWSSGAIAYELFGQRNPFLHRRLDSSTYQDEDLPEIQSAPMAVRGIVKELLCRNMRDRMTARDAAIILKVYLFAPSEWLRDDKYLVTQGAILRWLVKSSCKVLSQRRRDSVESMLKMSLLREATVTDVSLALTWLRQHQETVPRQ